jgi:4-oxalocrotonate tautomerase
MPWVTINLLQGRSEEKKMLLHKSVTKAVADSLGIPVERIHVQLVEMDRTDYSVGIQMRARKPPSGLSSRTTSPP